MAKTAAVKITIEMTSDDAARLLGKLAYDNDFRRRMMKNDTEALNELREEFKIDIEHHQLSDRRTVIRLPTKKQVQKVVREIQFPDPDPPMFGFCLWWGITAYAAAAADADE